MTMTRSFRMSTQKQMQIHMLTVKNNEAENINTKIAERIN